MDEQKTNPRFLSQWIASTDCFTHAICPEGRNGCRERRMAAVRFDTYMFFLIGVSYQPECNQGYQMLQEARVHRPLGA